MMKIKPNFVAIVQWLLIPGGLNMQAVFTHFKVQLLNTDKYVTPSRFHFFIRIHVILINFDN